MVTFLDKSIHHIHLIHSLVKNKNQDETDTNTHMKNIYQNLMDEYIIKSNELTLWDERIGISKPSPNSNLLG